MSDAYSKLKVAQLKAKLKERAQSGAGEKEDLVRRLQLCDAGDKHALPDGRNPTTLKAAEFRKALASRGLPCDLSINTRDELMQSLIDALKTEGGGTSAEAGSSAGGGGGGEDADELATRLALQVLELGEAGNPEGVLSLLGAAITRATPFAAQRKAYLSLARIIHPDKLPKLGQATKAFQHLVRAFEVLTAPEAPPQAAKAAARAHTAISRSNDGCFKTHLFCPRCKSQWGSADSGVMDFDYNFMMQGLKVYCCALCLCDFGCMTAEHRCPLCRKPFEYHPRDYHRQVTCGNARCSGTFGFWLYHVPARVEDDLRQEARKEQERQAKQREAAAARVARAARKGTGGASEAERRAQGEKLFVAGLLDACPRCGFEPPPGVSREELAEHLGCCTDKKAHAAHAAAVAAAGERRAKKAEARDAQAEAQNLAVWQFLGGDDSQAWLLTDTQVKKQCEERGLATDGTKEEMLARMASHASGRKMLTDGEAGRAAAGGGGGGGGGGKISEAALPSNLHSMSLPQLRAVCAANGLTPRGDSTSDLIHQLEAAAYAGEEAVLLLEEPAGRGGGAGRSARGAAAKPKRKTPCDDGDDGDESDGWQPEESSSRRKRAAAGKSYKEESDDDDE